MKGLYKMSGSTMVLEVFFKTLKGNFSVLLGYQRPLPIISFREMDKARIKSRETFLSTSKASVAFFFRSLKVKQKQGIISELQNDHGSKISNANEMAQVVPKHISQITKHEGGSETSTVQYFGFFKTMVPPSDALALDKALHLEECKQALFAM